MGWPLSVPTREEPDRPCSLATQWVSMSDNVITPPSSVALDTLAEASVRPVLTSIVHSACNALTAARPRTFNDAVVLLLFGGHDASGVLATLIRPLALSDHASA